MGLKIMDRPDYGNIHFPDFKVGFGNPLLKFLQVIGFLSSAQGLGPLKVENVRIQSSDEGKIFMELKTPSGIALKGHNTLLGERFL
jgi:hypothetical protein